MFVAKMKDGKLISLIEKWEKSKLMKLRNLTKFYCPGCEQPVQLRLGEQRVWHFAHQKDQTCSYEVESESDYHLSGKKQLYEWAKEYHEEVLLEPYLQKIHQRPDILVRSTNGQMIAIEYQCTSISPELFKKRTKSYQQIGIEPIWILGGKRIKRVDRSIVQLQRFDWLFTRYLQHASILHYCPHTRKFILLSQLSPFSTYKSLTNFHIFNHSEFPFSFLFKSPSIQKNYSVSDWLGVKKYWRYSIVNYRSSYAHRYMNKVFLSKNKTLSFYPSEAGLPTPFHFLIDTPSYLWQSWILTVFLDKFSTHQAFHLSQLYQTFKKMITREVFKLRDLPQVLNSQRLCPVKQYLFYLCELGIIEQINEDTFVKRKQIKFPNTIEEAFQLDNRSVTIFFRMNQGNLLNNKGMKR